MENLIRKSICLGETFPMEIDFQAKNFSPNQTLLITKTPPPKCCKGYLFGAQCFGKTHFPNVPNTEMLFA